MAAIFTTLRSIRANRRSSEAGVARFLIARIDCGPVQRVVTILAANLVKLGKLYQCEQPRAFVSPIIVLAKIAKSTGNDSGGFLKMGGTLGWYLICLSTQA
jgi:hypothetical protein